MKAWEYGKRTANDKKGPDTKQYFDNINHWLKIHTILTNECTAMSIGGVRLSAYYYRFKIIEDPTCTCGGGIQTAHH